MSSYTITHTDNKTDFTFNLLPPIHLNPNKKYEAALLSINLYNSIPNITKANNQFKYSTDNGVTWKIITLDIGSYEIKVINDVIQKAMVVNGDYDAENNEHYITLSPNIAQLKSIINITKNSYVVDLDINNSIGPTLGFQPGKIRYGYNISENIVDIAKVKLVLINVDFISGSYVNGFQSPVIYSFDPYKVAPGYKLDIRPNPSLIYYQVNRASINNVRIWLTDQNNELINLRGEEVTINIHIREVTNIKQEIKSAIKELRKENDL
jgi:hypothetical protein